MMIRFHRKHARDGQTDGIAVAYTLHALVCRRLSRVKTDDSIRYSHFLKRVGLSKLVGLNVSIFTAYMHVVYHGCRFVSSWRGEKNYF